MLGQTRRHTTPGNVNRGSWFIKRSKDAASDSSAVMHCGVASIAQRDQVLFRIIAGLAAKFLMVDFKT